MKYCIIGGGGASINEGIKKGLWDRIKDKEVWSLNFFWKFMPYLPTRQVWVDQTFFRNNMNDLLKLNEQGVQLYSKTNVIYANFNQVKHHATFRKFAENHTDKLFIGSQGLCGCYALALACKEEYDRVYTLGLDFGTTSKTDKNTHFYLAQSGDVKSTGLRNTDVYFQRSGSVKSTVKDFDYFLRFTKTKIYNVSLQSNISSFERVSYDQFFEML